MLVKALTSYSRASELDLSCNAISDAGISSLADYLKVNRVLCTGFKNLEDLSLLERCPHFRGCYVQASMVLGPEDVSLLYREVSSLQVWV